MKLFGVHVDGPTPKDLKVVATDLKEALNKVPVQEGEEVTKIEKLDTEGYIL